MTQTQRRPGQSPGPPRPEPAITKDTDSLAGSAWKDDAGLWCSACHYPLEIEGDKPEDGPYCHCNTTRLDLVDMGLTASQAAMIRGDTFDGYAQPERPDWFILVNRDSGARYLVPIRMGGYLGRNRYPGRSSHGLRHTDRMDHSETRSLLVHVLRRQ